MRVLIMAATEMEIAPFLQNNEGADHLITGVGAPAAMYHLQKKLQADQYDCVLQAGIAGSFKDDIALGETALVKRDVFADLGMFENQKLVSLFDTGFAGKDDAPYKNGWLENNGTWLQRFSLPKADAITVNTVTENETVLKEYQRIYQPALESMEGAALHYVCIMENISFLQLRAVSNKAGERDKSKWKIAAAIQNLNNHLHEMVQLLKQHG